MLLKHTVQSCCSLMHRAEQAKMKSCHRSLCAFCFQGLCSCIFGVRSTFRMRFQSQHHMVIRKKTNILLVLPGNLSSRMSRSMDLLLLTPRHCCYNNQYYLLVFTAGDRRTSPGNNSRVFILSSISLCMTPPGMTTPCSTIPS